MDNFVSNDEILDAESEMEIFEMASCSCVFFVRSMLTGDVDFSVEEVGISSSFSLWSSVKLTVLPG